MPTSSQTPRPSRALLVALASWLILDTLQLNPWLPPGLPTDAPLSVSTSLTDASGVPFPSPSSCCLFVIFITTGQTPIFGSLPTAPQPWALGPSHRQVLSTPQGLHTGGSVDISQAEWIHSVHAQSL